MLVAGRGYGWARSALATSRPTRVSQHVTGSRIVALANPTVVVRRNHSAWQQGASAGGVRDTGARRRNKSTLVENKSGEQVGVFNGGNKARMTPHKADDVAAEGARHRVSAIGGQERGESTMAAANGARSTTAVTDVGSKQKWMDYQMKLQARVGLLQESQAVESEVVQQCTVADSAVVDLTRKGTGDYGSSSDRSSGSRKKTSETHAAGEEVETCQQPEAIVPRKKTASRGSRKEVPAAQMGSLDATDNAQSASPPRTNGHANASSGTSSSVEGAIAEIAGARRILAVNPNTAAAASINGHAYSRLGMSGDATFDEYTSAVMERENFTGLGSVAAATIETPRRDPQGLYSIGNNGAERTSSATICLGSTNSSSTSSTATSQFERNLSSGVEAGVLEGRVTSTVGRRAWCNGEEYDAITDKSMVSPSHAGHSGTETGATISVESVESGHEPKDEGSAIVATTLEAVETTIGDGDGIAHNSVKGALLQRQQTRAQVENLADIYGKGVAAAAAAVADGAADDYNNVLNFLTDSKSSSSLPSVSSREKQAKTGSTPPASSSDTRERAAQGTHQASGASMQTPENPSPASTTGTSGDTGRATAWSNVHARRNLQILLEGLENDYGVAAGTKQNCVPKRTLAKVMPVFRKQVLTEPEIAFPGEDGERIRAEISRLCFDPKFRGDAVTRKKPQRVAQRHGRTFNFQSKANHPSGFTAARARIVEEVFIPRLVSLAKELFPEEVENARILLRAVDLSDPHEWFPLARLRKRKIIYHGGPTNSGKTYNAINRLKQAGANRKEGDPPAGLFCGPLRLLALEVYEQLNSQGVYCSLYTGQEKRSVPFATHVSCTIEMASLTQPFEVAVIDEIQMVDDSQRGQHWTNALLGLNCPEIHVCGGLEAADLVQSLCEKMGDDFELHEYARKTPLVAAEESLKGSYAKVQPGDAIVAFTRKDLFMIKAQIESRTKHKCSVVYGQLPQETRAHQARLFNTKGTGYDVLVASDAIGMGLNLNIRRVVFHSVSKRIAAMKGPTPIPPTLLKQIGGRAGRHGKDWDFGEVTCMYEKDMAYMQHVMATPIEPVPRAHIFPQQDRLELFANSLDAVAPMPNGGRRRLGDILEAMAREARVPDLFLLGEYAAIQKVADALHDVDNLTMAERFAICQAPINERNDDLVKAVAQFAVAHSERLPAFINMHLPARGVLPRTLDEFQGVCNKHAVLEVYKWMIQRFPEIESPTQLELAEKQKGEVVDLVYRALKTNVRINGSSTVGTLPHFVPDPSATETLRYLNGSKPGAGNAEKGARAYDFS